MDLYEAIEKANFTRGWTQQKFVPIPSRDNGINIPNPIVTTVLFQLRKIINATIKELGKPEKIIVEFARELKANKKYSGIADEIVLEEIERYKKKHSQVERYKDERIVKDIRTELHKAHGSFQNKFKRNVQCSI